ncbi:MAG: hypothetical protein WCF90_04685 [Methanomicrobiales archaeon]
MLRTPSFLLGISKTTVQRGIEKVLIIIFGHIVVLGIIFAAFYFSHAMSRA